jgi:hypothetical protein
VKGRTPRITMDVARECFTPKRWRNLPLHGNMRGTRYRWVSGLQIRSIGLDLPPRAARCKPINADAVLYDVRRIRRAKRKAWLRHIMAGHERCPGCNHWIDPDTCHCGDAITHNALLWGHSPVPMGCDCMRAMESQYERYESFEVQTSRAALAHRAARK